MPTVQELNDKVTALQTAVDAKQEQVATAVAAYKQTISDLQAQVDAGGTIKPEELQTAIDGLTATTADLESTPT